MPRASSLASLRLEKLTSISGLVGVVVPYLGMEDTGMLLDPEESEVEPLRPARGKLTLVFLAVIALGLFLGTALQSPDTTSGPMVGLIAPEITADLFPTGRFVLSEHLMNDGRPLVLNLWASWCPECREEFPALSEFSSTHPEIAVVGVAVNDERSDSLAYWEDAEPTHPVGYDTTRRLRDSYPGFGLPVTFIINESGTVTHQIDGTVTVELLESLFR